MGQTPGAPTSNTANPGQGLMGLLGSGAIPTSNTGATQNQVSGPTSNTAGPMGMIMGPATSLLSSLQGNR